MTKIIEKTVIKKTSPKGEVTTTSIVKTTIIEDSPLTPFRNALSFGRNINSIREIFEPPFVSESDTKGKSEYRFTNKNRHYTCVVKRSSITILNESGEIVSKMNYRKHK